MYFQKYSLSNSNVLVKYCQKVTLIQISGEKIPVFSKTSCQILPSFNLFGRLPAHACLLGQKKTRNKINGLEVLILMLSTYW
jgi:hypothetical protein